MGACLLAFPDQNFEITLFGAGDLFCIRQLVFGVETNLDALGEFYLIFSAKQCGLADAVEINTDQVGGRVVIGLVAA